MQDPTPWIAAGSTVGLLALAFTTIFRVMRTVPKVYRDQITAMANELAELRLANTRCERRVWALIAALQKAGIPVPQEAWPE